VLAQCNLSGMYSSGRVPGEGRDVVRAHMWMLLAARGGDSVARVSCEFASRRLRPAQRARAEELAQAWQVEHSGGVA